MWHVRAEVKLVKSMVSLPPSSVSNCANLISVASLNIVDKSSLGLRSSSEYQSMSKLLYPIAPAPQQPDKIAFSIAETGDTVTFDKLERRCNQAAQLFRSCGLARGDHIVLLAENCRQFLEICFAADRAGLYYTAISTHATTDEVAYITDNCNASLWIVSESKSAFAEHLCANLPLVKHRFIIGQPIDGCLNWDAAVASQGEMRISDELQGLDMLYSSGTTGRPKGIKWQQAHESPGQETMLVSLLGQLFGYTSETRYLSPAPLYHAAPLRHSMTVIKLGGTVTVMQRFDAERALQQIEAKRITHSQWVPTMFVRMLKLPDDTRLKYDCSTQQVALHAAAPCPVPIKEAMLDWWGPILHEYYAGTENNGFCAITSDEWQAHRGSVGKALLGKLHICDDDGCELPTGSIGTIYFSDGHPFSYHNDQERTAAAYNDRGWSTLGDIGRIDKDGYLYLLDRKSFVIISGGVNIYPQETENLLINHPKIMDAAVFGIPNEDFGEEIKAVVQLVEATDGLAQIETELIDYCRAHLATLKCPKTIDFVAQLPRHANGKLLKRELRDQYWSSNQN
jgi:long-chain acyl-CoA synthetase